MKKTFTINISGTIFHIEEDAYEKLQGYLLKLKAHFGNDAEGREIVADIENRISELFNEKSKGENKVVVSEWVDEVITTMGTPEDFIAQESAGEPLTGTVKRKRRLYRDTENRYIGGVCSGLGAYFKVDPIVMRILFVVLLFANGIGILAYLVLWIAVPGAQTTTQKLEMRGEEVNISNIERTIRDDGPEVKDATSKDATTYAALSEPVVARPRTSQAGDAATGVAKGILKIIVIAVGIFLIVAGFLGLLGLISTVVVGQTFLSDWPLAWNGNGEFTGLLNQFISPGGAAWGLFFIGLLAGIPLLAMLYVGTKLVFNYRSNSTAVGLGMVGIWLLALVGLVVVSANEASGFKSTSSLSGTETIYPTPGKTLALQLGEDKFGDFSNLDWDLDRFKAVQVDGKSLLLGEPCLDIEKSSANEIVLVIKKRARGKTQAEANEYIRKIVYNYQVSDTTITFDRWFLPGENSRWRDQRVDMTLKIPEGTAVYLGENMEEVIHNIENVSNTWDGDMIGKTWIMTPEGLALKESPEAKRDSIP